MAASTKDTLIRTKGLSRTFEIGDYPIHALDRVSMQVRHGELLAVMGPSGSGKTTLMNILGCLDQPTDGSYELLDQPVAEMDDAELSALRNRYIGFVFQSFHLLPRLTALENVLLPLRFASESVVEARNRAPDLLKRLGLEDRMDHRPNQMSGGQRQRTALARALVSKPPLLLADEPTGNLDSKTAADILSLLKELNEDGQTIIVVTHESEVASHAHRIVHMRDGQIERESFN